MIIDPKFPYRSQIENIDPVFTFTPELRKKAHKFGLDQYQTSKDKYARRGQTNPSAIVEQIQTGKITEDMMWLKLSPAISAEISKPDWNIYGAREKNWDSDLKIYTSPLIRLGVKSQNERSAAEFSTSWIFEYRAGEKYDTDRGVFSEEAKQPGNFVVFSSIDLRNLTGRLQAILAVSTLHEKKLFEPPVLERLRDNKLAVYMKTILEKVK